MSAKKLSETVIKNGVATAKSYAFNVLRRGKDGKPTAYEAWSSGFTVGDDHWLIVAPSRAALSRLLSSGKFLTPKFSAKNFQNIEITKHFKKP